MNYQAINLVVKCGGGRVFRLAQMSERSKEPHSRCGVATLEGSNPSLCIFYTKRSTININRSPPHPRIRVIVPITFVLPSRSRIISPSLMNSGRYLKENLTSPRSSFLRICSPPQIYSRMTTCWMVPQCNTPSYFAFIVVELCSTCMSASKDMAGSGFYWLSTTTMPLRMSFRTSFSVALVAFRQKQASSPAKASFLSTLFTWIDLMTTLLKFLCLSGPRRQDLFTPATPDLTMPETTSPTPSTRKFSLISNQKGWAMASSMETSFCLSILQMKLVRFSNPVLLTLETGKMGQTVPEAISSATFICSFSDVLSVISMGNLLSSLCLSSFLISSMVQLYLFSGARSILVMMTKKGILRKRQSPMCSFVIFWSPMFAPTTTHAKSGMSPVRPLMVVLRYFSCPQRSTIETILWLWVTTSFQYLFLFWLNRSGRICLPSLLNPMIY